jgi:hypothetical protein
MRVRARFSADEPNVRVFWRADVPSSSTRAVDTSSLGAEVRSGDEVSVPRGNAMYMTMVDASGNVSPVSSYRVVEAAPQASSSSSSLFGGSTLTAVIAGGAALIALIALAALVAVRRRRRSKRERDILSLAHARNANTDVGEADSSTHLTRSRGMLPEFEAYTLKEGSVMAVAPTATTARGGTTTGATPTGITPGMTSVVAIQHGYAMTEPGWSEFSVAPEEEVVYEGDPYEHYAVQGAGGARV